MRNKRLLRTLSALCLTLVLASGFTVPAFAQGAAPPPAVLRHLLEEVDLIRDIARCLDSRLHHSGNLL